jgi:uncharacterized protein YpuA (DUF1002 family)
MNKPREEEKEIKKIISDNVHNYKINCDTKEVISQIKKLISSLLEAERDRVLEGVVNSDRIYTDEHDRRIANDYKEQIIKAIKRDN